MTMIAFLCNKAEVWGGLKRLNYKPCISDRITALVTVKKIVDGHDGKY